MDEDIGISIVIPTYGLEPALESTINNLITHLEDLTDKSYEIVIVHTPKGNSVEHSKKIIEKYSPLIQLIIEERRGYGVAYVTGFRAAKGDIIVTMDADLTYPAKVVYPLYQYMIDKNLEFITTDRLNSHEEGAFRWTNKFGNGILALIMNFLFYTRFNDSQSGMWIIRKSSLSKMRCYGIHWAFSAEIKIEASLRRLRRVEVPIPYHRRGAGSSTNSVTHGIKIGLFMFAKRFGLAKYFPSSA